MISIAIPCYEMNGLGVSHLNQLLNSIIYQDFSDYEIVISDHSLNDDLMQLCKNIKNTKIKYYRNTNGRGSSSANINNAINMCSHDTIKIMFQDDYFIEKTALTEIYDAFIGSGKNWMCCAYMNTNSITGKSDAHIPQIPEDLTTLLTGNNLIGSPSAIIFNRSNQLFDESLIWFMDCEWYYRMIKTVGLPGLFNKSLIANRVWDGSVSNTNINKTIVTNELKYLKGKYQMTLKEKFESMKSTPCDINEHFDTIKKYASECETITEMGVRYIVSTWALMSGMPKKLTSIDIKHPSIFGGNLYEVINLCADNDIEFRFIESSTLTLEIEPTDLLFIDTLHTYAQLAQELAIHSKNAKKYILMHDTETFGYKDELKGNNGLVQAIYEFLADNKDWRLKEIYRNNNGLTVLERIQPYGS